MNRLFYCLLLLLASCSFVVEDKQRGSHPVSIDGRYVVEVNNSEKETGASKTSCLNFYSYPMWCDYDKEIRAFNNEIVAGSGKLVNNPFSIFVNCNLRYQEVPVCETIQKTDVELKKDGNVFISVNENGNSENGVLLFYIDGTNNIFFQIYYILYNSFCLNTGNRCCITRQGDSSLFYLSIPSGINDRLIMEYVDSIKTIIDNKGVVDNDILAVAHNTFMCNFIDICNYNKWYYSSLVKGVGMPEQYIAEEKWTGYLVRNQMKRLRISKVGLKVVHNGKVDQKTREQLKLVLKKALTQGDTEPYKSRR